MCVRLPRTGLSRASHRHAPRRRWPATHHSHASPPRTLLLSSADHYLRIFNSWVEAYSFPPAVDGVIGDPVITGVPFNDAYRYMDWLLTVPLLLIEIVFCMKLSDAEMSDKAWKLGSAAGLMIILGYPGELIIDGDLSGRWFYWTLAMIPFLYIVYTLLVGLNGAIAKESDPKVKTLLTYACQATVVSWCTYPVVYIIPMFGFTGGDAVIGIQLGYCVSDIISKCGVGFLIYNVRSAALPASASVCPASGNLSSCCSGSLAHVLPSQRLAAG